MKSFFGLAALLLAGLLTIPAAAQDASPAVAIDDEVLNLLLESRSQKPASQATPQEREAALEELTGIYLVSDLPRARELGESPRIKAQIDLQRRVVLFSNFANDFMASNQPTDQEIFNAYQEQLLQSQATEFKARHILVETQGAAMELIGELKEGADFAALATEHSTGPSGPSGGDLGWFTATAMVKPFSDAVAALEDGAFTDEPVQTQYGWHVILREDSRDSAPPPLDSVSDVIRQQISQQKFLDFVAELRAKATE